MSFEGTAVATFVDHAAAEAAIKRLTEGGFDMKHLSVIGKGYHTEEKVVGFYTTADRVKFWGSRGAFWGGLWGLFFGGLFMTIPVVGHVVVLGYLAGHGGLRRRGSCVHRRPRRDRRRAVQLRHSEGQRPAIRGRHQG